MNNEIQKFDFKGAPLRTLTDKAEEPWFVAKDVCDILGHSNVSMALDRLDDDERSKFNLGRQGETNIVEDRFEKGRPNYTLRRLKFTLAVVGLVVSVTLMLTWHGGGLTGALVVEGVYLATALWLTVRFAPRDDVDGDV